MASKLTRRIQDTQTAAMDTSKQYIDSYYPPSQRSEHADMIKSWASQNPKLAAFVAAHLLLSGPPILLFLGFTITVLTSSIIVCLLTALTVAFAFAAFCAGLGLLLLVPTLFLTGTLATFLFVSGAITTVSINYFNTSPRTATLRARSKDSLGAVGEKVRDATNGTLDPNATATLVAEHPVMRDTFSTGSHNGQTSVARERSSAQARSPRSVKTADIESTRPSSMPFGGKNPAAGESALPPMPETKQTFQNSEPGVLIDQQRVGLQARGGRYEVVS